MSDLRRCVLALYAPLLELLWEDPHVYDYECYDRAPRVYELWATADAEASVHGGGRGAVSSMRMP